MRIPRRAPRTVPVVDRTGSRTVRPRTADAPGVTPSKRMPATATPAQRKAADEQAQFKAMTRQQQIEAAITAHVQYVRRQNSPEVIEKLSETEFWRYVFDQSMRNVQFVDGGSDPRIILRSASMPELRAAWAAVRKLAPETTAAVTSPKMPNKDPWWSFIRDLRLRS